MSRDQATKSKSRQYQWFSKYLQGFIVLFVLVAAVVGFIGRQSLLNGNFSPYAKGETDRHAQVAADVMGRGRSDPSVTAIVYGVVGTTQDTTIEALEAQGTKYNGKAVLRITVTIIVNEGSFGERTDRSQSCYQYDFMQNVVFHKLSECPNKPVLKLQQPADISLPVDAANRLLQILNALSVEQRASTSAIQSAIEAGFPPPAKVLVEGNTAKQVNIYINSGEQCLTGYTFPDRPPITTSVSQGASCFGG